MTLQQNIYEESRTCSQFLKFCFQFATLPNFKGEKAFLRENLTRYISGTKYRRKLKFGEVGLKICQNCLRNG